MFGPFIKPRAPIKLAQCANNSVRCFGRQLNFDHLNNLSVFSRLFITRNIECGRFKVSAIRIFKTRPRVIYMQITGTETYIRY